MATETPAAGSLLDPPFTPLLNTTRRGIAAVSFCLGMWSTLVFWWYPYGMFIAGVGLILGSLAVAMQWRVGSKPTDHLALYGVLLCSNTIFLALMIYRVVQLFFGDLSFPKVP